MKEYAQCPVQPVSPLRTGWLEAGAGHVIRSAILFISLENTGDLIS